MGSASSVAASHPIFTPLIREQLGRRRREFGTMPPRRVVSRADLPVPQVSSSKSASVPPTSRETTPNPSGSGRGRTAPSRGVEGSRGAGGLQVLEDLWKNYSEATSKQLKACDAFQLFLMLTGIAQFLYCVLVTNYPFNAFLGGFAATVGQFVLTASLRSQINPENKEVFPTISPERAMGDYVFGSLILHFFVFSYLG